MIARVKEVKPSRDFVLRVIFDDGCEVIYDMNNDIRTLPGYSELAEIPGLWEQAKLDESRTVIFWNDRIDIPADAIYEKRK